MNTRVLLLLTLVSLGSCMPEFRARIPNGGANVIPDSGITCAALGHQQCVPGAARNAFGLDFQAADYRWTVALCKKDSDGDGLTNGEELGDPCCEWTEVNRIPLRRNFLSHPGDKDEDGAKDGPKCKKSGSPTVSPPTTSTKKTKRTKTTATQVTTKRTKPTRTTKRTKPPRTTTTTTTTKKRRTRTTKPPRTTTKRTQPPTTRRPRTTTKRPTRTRTTTKRTRAPTTTTRRTTTATTTTSSQRTSTSSTPSASPSESPSTATPEENAVGTIPKPLGSCRSGEKRRGAACVCFATVTNLITMQNRAQLVENCVELLRSKENIRALNFACDDFRTAGGRINTNRVERVVDLVAECVEA